ncbi:MAG TPA: BON domain-containing protein [Longimicrobiaceae bacterium]|nr:BON domain-containing protein [Longimicrobiaceae bacterium]
MRDGSGRREARYSAQDALVFILGALGGLALGAFLSRRVEPEQIRGAGTRLRERARDLRDLAVNLRPGRLRRASREQLELTRLEDAVLDLFLADEVLRERPIDVGAISRGIVELSGTVRTDGDADHAVALASRAQGVETVVNRMEVEEPARRKRRRKKDDAEEGGMAGHEWTGRQSGMGRRRQGHGTDPDQPDDSQHMREDALEDADRAEFEAEGLGHSQPVLSARPKGTPENPTDYPEDELDNQSPYGKRAVSVPEQPQALNAQGQLGEGTMPGTELRLEAADLPVKPHGKAPRDTDAG